MSRRFFKKALAQLLIMLILGITPTKRPRKSYKPALFSKECLFKALAVFLVVLILKQSKFQDRPYNCASTLH